MDSLINVIIAWLSLSSPTPLPPALPNIKLASPQQLLIIHAVRALRQWDESNIMGAYDPLSRKIYLRADWDSRRAADVSVLAHELVHFLQAATHEKFECPAAREAAAYAAQRRWLELYGTDLQREFGIDAMTLKLRTACLPH